MAKEGCEMEEQGNWQEDGGWMSDDVRVSIDGREKGESRKMRRLYYGVNNQSSDGVNKIPAKERHSEVDLYDTT